MPYLHDPYPSLSKPPYERLGSVLDPTFGPDALVSYGPYVGSGYNVQVPAPYRPVGATDAGEIGNRLLAFALIGGAIWLGLRLTRPKRKNYSPEQRRRSRKKAKLIREGYSDAEIKARMKKNPRGGKWIKGAIKRPGAFRSYMKRRYGNAAFKADGTLKSSYVQKVISDPRVSSRVHKQAVLARTLKSM